MQALFAYQRSEGSELAAGEKLLNQSINKFYDLYIHHLSLLVEVHNFAKQQIEDGKTKRMPTPEDLNPNMRFVENRVLEQLQNHPQLEKHIAARRINWAEHSELIRRIFTAFKASEAYQEYMLGEEPTYKAQRRIIYKLYQNFLFDNEHLRSIFEEKSMLWMNDFDTVNDFVIRTISDFKKDVEFGGVLVPLYKDEEEDKAFVKDLFRKTATNSLEYQSMIEKKLVNWDLERIASTDVLLMKMAICEFVNISSIPTKVTMNEYIEISKEYSTPKSKVFINGILDKVLFELKEQGKVKKMGKGLIGN